MQINRRKYNRARLGTVRLQSQYRGNAVRKVNAATKIQSVERMHVQNSAYRKLKSATIALQCFARRGKAKKIFDQVVLDATARTEPTGTLPIRESQLPELYANDSAETLQDITNPARAHVGSIEPCPDEENLGSGVTDIVINDELPIQAEVVSVSFIVAMKTLFFYTLH